MNDKLGISELLENLEDDQTVVVHLRGESEGWFRGRIDKELSDADVLFLKRVPGWACSRTDVRVEIASIDAIKTESKP